jgi:hypothetical protein
MDVYLPNEFYELRDDLPDWSDTSPAGTTEHKSSDEECADPSWRAL